MTIKQEIKALRSALKRHRVDQTALADASGVHKATVSRILRGKQMPSAETFLAMQAAAYRLIPKAA